MDGTIKWFDNEKGYGFIASPIGDVFLHVSALAGLQEGLPVNFEVIQGLHGPMAAEVRLQSALPPRGATTSLEGAVVLPSRSDDKADFRGVAWRSSPSDVMDRENAPALRALPDMLIFDGAIAGIPCEVIYIFVEDELCRGKYIPQRHSNEQLVDDFFELQRLLSEKYATADEVRDMWSDGDHDSGEISLAVARGHLTMSRLWRFTTTEIFLGISAEDFDVRLVIEYQSIELKAADSAARRAEVLRDL